MKDWLAPTLVTIVCYGLWGFFPKLAANQLDPKNVVIYQSIGAVLMTLALPFLPGFKWQGYEKTSIFALLTGIIGVIGNLFFVAALSKGKASIITPLTALYPVITLLLAVIFLQETLTIRHGVGIGLAIIAALLLGA
ncbi:MAG: EamA family transporter [Anaerolineae bacterium]|nr:EamA family transporter [Anaerolineae bacterium]